MPKEWHVTVRLKKPLTHTYGFKPTKDNVIEAIRDDLNATCLSQLEKLFEIEIKEVTE